MKIFLFLTTFLFASLAFSQQHTNGYWTWPTTVTKKADSSIELYYFHFETYTDWETYQAPAHVCLNFDSIGNLIDSTNFTFINDTSRFLVHNSFDINDTTVLVGEMYKIGYYSTPALGVCKVNGNVLEAKTIIIDDENGILKYQQSIINSRGNLLVVFNDRNYDTSASYHIRLHLIEYDLESNKKLQHVKLTSDSTLINEFELSNLYEFAIDSSLMFQTPGFDIVKLNNQDFQVKEIEEGRISKRYLNPIVKLPTEGQYITITAHEEVSDDGVLDENWHFRSREAGAYILNEKGEEEARYYFETSKTEIIFAQFCNNFDVIDTSNMWVAVGGYDELTSIDLPERNNASSVNIWNASITGNINCYNSFFEQEGKNYTPWQVVATSDGGAMIFGTVRDFVNTPWISNNLFVLKVNSNCELTSLKEWNMLPMAMLEVYPNPTQDMLHINLSEHKISNGAVYNMQGKQVLSFTTNSIAVQMLPAGLYAVEVTTTKGDVLQSKFVKE